MIILRGCQGDVFVCVIYSPLLEDVEHTSFSPDTKNDAAQHCRSVSVVLKVGDHPRMLLTGRCLLLDEVAEGSVGSWDAAS